MLTSKKLTSHKKKKLLPVLVNNSLKTNVLPATSSNQKLHEEKHHETQSNTMSIHQTRNLIQQALKKGAAISRLSQVIEKLKTHNHLLQSSFLALAKNLPRQLVQNIHFKKKFASSFEQKQWETHLQRIREEQLVLLAENRLLVQKVKDLNNDKRYTASNTFGTFSNTSIPHQYLFIKLVQYNIRTQLVHCFIKWKFRTQTLKQNEKQYYLCSAIALHMWNSCHTTANKYLAFYHVRRQVKYTQNDQKLKLTCAPSPLWKSFYKKDYSCIHSKEHVCGTYPNPSYPRPCCVSNTNSTFMLKYNVSPLRHSRQHKLWIHDTNTSNCYGFCCRKPFHCATHDQTPGRIAFLENRQENPDTLHGE